jgi:glycopeptide antibiotics resistance protein
MSDLRGSLQEAHINNMNLQKHSVNNEASTSKKVTIVLFVIYFLVLFWIILFKLHKPFANMGSRRNINLIPFHQPMILNGKIDYGEMILNVLIFIPLGVYAGMIFKRQALGKKILFCLLISLSCEVLQFIFALGASDITDIISNTFGGIIGLIILIVTKKLFNNDVKVHKFINIFAAIATLLVVSFLLLLKMNMLPIRYQ